MKNLVAKIEQYLTLGGTWYITCINGHGEKVKIRVSDHSANDRNNIVQTVSFVSNTTESVSALSSEFKIDLDTFETVNYESIESILSDYDIRSYYDNSNLIKIS